MLNKVNKSINESTYEASVKIFHNQEINLYTKPFFDSIYDFRYYKLADFESDQKWLKHD